MPMELITTLNGIWFLLAGIFLVGYSLTDGFDLGSGILHIFTKDEEIRLTNMNAIAPVWDGNEVWLIAGGGMLFAAFPIVYAVSFSAFYLAMFLVLWALILRAVAFEYRNKKDSPTWKKWWDIAYWIGNIVPAFLFGVAVGNAVIGIPIDEKGVFYGNLFTLLKPIPILMGFVSVFMFLIHGVAYLLIKTEGKAFEFAKKAAIIGFVGYVVSVAVADFFIIALKSELFNNFFDYPLFWIAPILMIIGVFLYFKWLVVDEKYDKVIYASSITITGTVLTIALASYPVFIRSTIDEKYNLTIWNSSSSDLTLTIMLVSTLIFLPIVIGYTTYVYKVFKGKVSAKGGYGH
ncbi:cytochrome d ubiquinol oxidase subunit II [Hydrogenothermus marinus]|uniref:Cytochrome bd-I ubiquinol oxidase subunit 2 apoprotein n=1 Tax=Hydrogenothermus marinus TaxID=133270 RepID=A0A3M0BKU6_9AQUI|nr:cytochrome d ubiquinol oxidase subunit II [Hydrogenothermus marinus]RMA97186.1 cytochrome bd-I ubiquinol oxidase subunit 2 apoprotein [Hydrogenothermus marinus]